MKMEYRRDLQHSYLVAETEEDTTNYIAGMITENQIPGLLACECRRLDQKELYYYDVTSRISLAEICRYKKIKAVEILSVIKELLQVLEGLEEYLIPSGYLCMDWNYIYLDAINQNTSFCCLPIAEREIEAGLQELLEMLLPRLDHQEREGVAAVYELYQYILQGIFSIEEIKKILERTEESGFDREEKRRELDVEDAEGDFPESLEKETVMGKHWDKDKETAHEKALEDFFGEEKEEEKEERKLLFWKILGGGCGIGYLLSGVFIMKNLPMLLIPWGIAGGVVGSVLLVLGMCLSKKKNEQQIEAQFALYQEEKNGEPDRKKSVSENSELSIEKWMSKEEPVRKTAEKTIPWEGNEYTQVLVNKKLEQNLVMEELYPIKGRRICIEGEAPVLLGTLKGQVDHVLPSAAVSRIHAKLEKREGVWYLQDMNSRNGTWINEKELCGEQKMELHEQDQIRFADVIYEIITL